MTDLITSSVTRGDYNGNGSSAMPATWLVQGSPIFGHLTALNPVYSVARDRLLANTPDLEAMWGSAVYKASTKFAARGFTIADTGERRAARYQELFLTSQYGKGWINFVLRGLRDFLCTDNGWFIEVIRASKAKGSRIVGLAHLDSLRCTRTGDPANPVIYMDRNGEYHTLKDYQVIDFVDMPSPRAEMNGVGLCAAHRAYPTISKIAAMETYVKEKIVGGKTLAVHLVSGVTSQQLNDAELTASVQKQNKGYVYFNGSLIIPGFDPNNAPAVATIPLSEMPDGFDPDEERRNAYLIYANAIGVAVQDIQPLSGQGLGTGTQTVILDEASDAQGLAALVKQVEHTFNERILPNTTTFMFSINDIRDQRQRAEVSDMRAGERDKMVKTGTITAEESRQLAVESGDLPRSFIEESENIEGDSVTDEDKPEADTAEAEEGASPPMEDTDKARRKKRITNVDKGLDDALVRAKALYEEVS